MTPLLGLARLALGLKAVGVLRDSVVFGAPCTACCSREPAWPCSWTRCSCMPQAPCAAIRLSDLGRIPYTYLRAAVNAERIASGVKT